MLFTIQWSFQISKKNYKILLYFQGEAVIFSNSVGNNTSEVPGFCSRGFSRSQYLFYLIFHKCRKTESVYIGLWWGFDCFLILRRSVLGWRCLRKWFSHMKLGGAKHLCFTTISYMDENVWLELKNFAREYHVTLVLWKSILIKSAERTRAQTCMRTSWRLRVKRISHRTYYKMKHKLESLRSLTFRMWDQLWVKARSMRRDKFSKKTYHSRSWTLSFSITFWYSEVHYITDKPSSITGTVSFLIPRNNY